MSTISPETALVYTMVIVAVSDMDITPTEQDQMTGIVGYLPAMSGYQVERLASDIDNCMALLDSDEGIDAVLGLVAEAVPETHYDLIYAVACEIAVSDGTLTQEELRLLEIFRHELEIDRLTAAAIERGVAAKRRVFPADF